MNRVLKPLQECFQLLHPLLQRADSPLMINLVRVRSRFRLRVAPLLDHPVEESPHAPCAACEGSSRHRLLGRGRRVD